jgi:RsiW-degrading membrane proteinase PrsW (M82 family)
MSISFPCVCGKRLRAKEEWAGKRLKCPACGSPVVVPQAPAPPDPEPAPPPEPVRPARPAPVPTAAPAAALERYKHLLADKPERSWGDYAYWALLLALVPLLLSLLVKEGEPVGERLERTIAKAPAEVKMRVLQVAQAVEEGKAEPDELIDALPGGRVEGAHLPRKAFAHYLYGLLAAGGFFLLAVLLVPAEDGRPLPLLLIGLFTGTAGILLLLLAQFLAEWTQGRIFVSGNIFLLALFWIAWAVGFSYRAALDPETGFLSSFLGFTFGVGLCEEVCKALPLIWYYRSAERPSWRDACAWGFASGVGFGIAEAVMYSGNHYNGIAPWGTYVVRFVSCVALHALWSAAVALFIHKHQTLIQGDLGWQDFIPRVVLIVSVPMLLHGLYDTALKKDLNVLALAAAVVSFAWLVWCLESARGGGEAAPRPTPGYA